MHFIKQYIPVNSGLTSQTAGTFFLKSLKLKHGLCRRLAILKMYKCLIQNFNGGVPMNTKDIRRGDIYYADLDPVVGSEQGGIRPVVIIQNDTGNRFSPTVIVSAITTSKTKHHIPTHIYIPRNTAGLPADSTILTEQVKTLDKKRLIRFVGSLNRDMMEQVNKALAISFGFETTYAIQSQVG
jgi:mRNA interferase MazF